MTVSASLEIHVIDVGQGDSVLVVNRDLDKVRAAIGPASAPADPIDYVPYAIAEAIPLAGTVKRALLIDGGDDEYGGDVLNYLTEHGVLDPKKVYQENLDLMVSHFHDDHIAGLRSIFRERVPPVKGKRGSTKARYRPARIYMPWFTGKSKPRTVGYRLLRNDLKEAKAGLQFTEQIFVMRGGRNPEDTDNVLIDLGTGVNGIGITVVLLAAAQGVWDAGIGNVRPVASVGKTVDQNDRSIVAVLQYGSFRCLLGGDIAGNGGPAGGNTGANDGSGGSAYFSQHGDVESVLEPALEAYFPATAKYKAGQPKFTTAGYCTVLKANHHGSASSVDVHLLATVQPLVFVASSGVKARFQEHPTQPVLNRVTDTQTNYWGVRAKNGRAADTVKVKNTIDGRYITEVADRYKKAPFNLRLDGAKIMGDVIIRPVDEYVADLQNATKPGRRLCVQVYGTGDQTILVSLPDTSLQPTEPLNAPAAIYRIGPFLHYDTH